MKAKPIVVRFYTRWGYIMHPQRFESRKALREYADEMNMRYIVVSE